MAATTIDYRHTAIPTNTSNFGVKQEKSSETCENIKSLNRTYVAPSAIAADKNIIMFEVREPARILSGKLYSDGAVATADASVGVIPMSTLDDTNIAVFGSGIDIATAGVYELMTGAANASLMFDITVPSYIVIRTATAGLAEGDVLKLSMGYIDIA